jgi:hypothetical protein
MDYFFSKRFDSDSLCQVDYHRCRGCGFTASKTHLEMSDDDWVRLNTGWHDANNLRQDNPWNRSQRHFNQALMIHLMHRHGIVERGKWLDYASGQGGLSRQLHSHFGLELLSFEKFVEPTSFPVSASELQPRGYALVTNTAMFEHARDRETLDEIESYVGEGGCLGIHTLVRGEIPADPDWMYLLPVHCAFFTNKSMDMLMRQWGYTCSAYNEHAKMWAWFKTEPKLIGEKVAELNQSIGWEYLHFKAGFMDFWP